MADTTTRTAEAYTALCQAKAFLALASVALPHDEQLDLLYAAAVENVERLGEQF